MDLNALPKVWCSHRFVSTDSIDLIVIHTNEGAEGPKSAENLAHYLARGNVVPGYHYIVDEDSAVEGCPPSQRCYGAGGVNSRALHICITGYAAQTDSQWNDPASQAAVKRASDIAAELARQKGVPFIRITNPPTGRGVCGHADVSRYYPSSQGHTDPGAQFPWAKFMGPQPTPDLPASVDDMTEFFYRNPVNGAIYHFAGNTRAHLNKTQQALLVLAAALEKPTRLIVDLGDLNAEQIQAMNRFPLVGPA